MFGSNILPPLSIEGVLCAEILISCDFRMNPSYAEFCYLCVLESSIYYSNTSSEKCRFMNRKLKKVLGQILLNLM